MPIRPPVIFAALMGLAVFILITGIFPDADPARVLPGFQMQRTLELVVEAPAKAHEARNWALFGEWQRNPADNYQFWRVQAPVWVYPLAWTFDAFGVSYPTLRMFSLAVTAAGFLGFLVAAVSRLPPFGAMAAIWLLATNVYFTQIGRSGLVEVAIQTGLMGMVLCLLVARAHPSWLVLSQLAFALAFFAKSGAVYAFPVLVVMNVWTFLEWRRAGSFPVWRWVPVATAVAVAAFTTWYVLHPEYLRTLEWNTGHLLTGMEEEQSRGPWWYRFDMNRIYYSWFVLFPGAGMIGLPAMFWLGYKVWTDRGRDRFELVLLLWIVCAFLALYASRIWTMRHSSILFFPNYLLIGWAAAQLWEIGQVLTGRARFALVALVSAVALTLGVHIAHQTQVLVEQRFELRQAAERIMAEVGPTEAVFIGRYAVPLLLETPYDTYYVKPGFNTEPERINALGVTHGLIVRDDIATEFIHAAHPRFRRPSRLAAFQYRDVILTVHAYPPDNGPRPSVITPPIPANRNWASPVTPAPTPPPPAP